MAIIRHPRIGEYAFGFITSTIILHRNEIDEELCCVYVPTNHLYLGDIFLINTKDIMRPKLSVREGIGNYYSLLAPSLSILSALLDHFFFFFLVFSAEIVISGGTSVPKRITAVDTPELAA